MRRIVGIAAALAAVVFLAVPSAAAAERGVVRGTVLESALTRTDEGGTFIEVHVRGEGIWTASVWVSSENAKIFVQAARLREGDRVAIGWVKEAGRPWIREINVIEKARLRDRDDEADEREERERDRREEGEHKERRQRERDETEDREIKRDRERGEREDRDVKRDRERGERDDREEGEVKRDRKSRETEDRERDEPEKRRESDREEER